VIIGRVPSLLGIVAFISVHLLLAAGLLLLPIDDLLMRINPGLLKA
jgi:hypothetical protein